ncbi:MAG: CHAD domain-containing protein [Candidatus Sulfotelmatobacter sp.]
MPIAPKRSRAVFQKLERDLLKLSDKPRAENIHRFRTGTRRLQVLLGDLSSKPARGQKKLLKMLGKIRKRAGKVRDLDVQLAALRRLKVVREPRRKTQLVNHLIELRQRQEDKLRKLVDGKTVRETRKRLLRAGKEFDPKASRDPLTVARETLLPLQRETEPVTEALLHRYRILSKRARYTAEFADPGKNKPDAEAQKLISHIKRIQDALGDWHDWFTLSQTAGEKMGAASESALAAELQNVTGAKYRHAVAILGQLRAKPVEETRQLSKASAGTVEKTTHSIIPAA